MTSRPEPVSARAIRRAINLALDSAGPGCEIEVEAEGIRVRVKRDGPRDSMSGSPDDKALDDVRRKLEAAGLV